MRSTAQRRTARRLGFAILLCLASGSVLHAQSITPAYLDRVSAQHQACLDSGARMPDCATEYYATMDRLLNQVYGTLRSGASSAAKEALRKEQLAWLRRRDALGVQLRHDVPRDGIIGADVTMIVYSRQGDFVKNRILELLKR